MSTTEKQPELESFLPLRFTQVKRIDNNSEVNAFYSDCKTRLCNVAEWNNMSLLNSSYKVSNHDAVGSLLNRVLEKGDFIKVISDSKIQREKHSWFLVDHVDHQKEIDSSEESVFITLIETENPTLINGLLSINSLKNKCELRLRRLINTISMDIKIINQHTIDQSKDFLNHFRWEIFAKQILLQL